MGMGTLIWVLLIGGVIFMMMKKGGGGCCGGHDHGGHDHGGHDHNATPDHSNCEMDHKGHQEQVTELKDPVCGMDVKDDSITSEYEGKTYTFCSESCQGKFKANPADFVK